MWKPPPLAESAAAPAEVGGAKGERKGKEQSNTHHFPPSCSLADGWMCVWSAVCGACVCAAAAAALPGLAVPLWFHFASAAGRRQFHVFLCVYTKVSKKIWYESLKQCGQFSYFPTRMRDNWKIVASGNYSYFSCSNVLT